ncbi:MAG: hypothetical protein AB1726_13775 [Planctomycetota bacterium]
MQISSLSRGVGLLPLPASAPATTTPFPVPSPAGEEPPASERCPDTVDIQRGVLRNLLAGHYRGVADVRLRINFFDELQALTAGAGPAEAPPADPLAPPVDPPLDDPASSTPVTEEPTGGGLTLPALSPPHGNGKAYAKFLAIYEEMLGITGEPDDGASGSEEPEAVDVTA